MPELMSAVSRYQKLVDDISHLYKSAQKSLARFYWGTGKRIVEVEQDGEVRARYGSKLLETLSRDLSRNLGRGFSVPNLTRMRRLYLENPILSTSKELAWSRQVELLPVSDSKKRRRLEKKAASKGLTARQIRALVKAESEGTSVIPARLKRESSGAGSREPLTPKRGELYAYQIVEKKGALCVDRGFKFYWSLLPAQAERFQKGDIVLNRPGEASRKSRQARKDPLFTYEADCERVVDGDTLWMLVYVNGRKARGFREEKLRLRGIDCPELDTPEGEAAKRFVEEQVALAQSITITTTKPDKWDRYLSDIFLLMKDGTASSETISKSSRVVVGASATTEVFLNNLLLEKGFAVRKDSYSLSDWDEEQ
jgi:endonuclease YncB( thermonuclease family)